MYFSHVIFNDKPYYELFNMWQNKEVTNRPDYDSDIECDGSDDCDIDEDILIYPNNDDKLEYVIEKHKDMKHMYSLFENCDINLLEKIHNNDLDKIFLVGYEKLTICNVRGWNDDHRGSNHCRIVLDQICDINIQNMITMKQFIDICYQLKSHKWDTWYELYCGIKYFGTKKNKISLSITFDHGS